MKIHAIQTGIVHVKTDFLRGSAAAGNNAVFMARLFTDRKWVDLPIFCWVIEHDEGVIVVDTGDRADTNSNFISQSTYTIRPEEEIGAQLGKLGIRPRDVSKVILTHLHGDHVNGMQFFPDVPVYLGPNEYRYYESRFGGMFNRRTTRLPRWFAPQSLTSGGKAFGPYAESFPITRAGDVVAVPTPGHTRGHISVIALSEDVHFFMAGDLTYNQPALLSQTLQGPSLSLKDHPASMAQALAYARKFPTVYLPAHDWQSGERLAKQEVVAAG